jgi:hypothetical protein
VVTNGSFFSSGHALWVLRKRTTASGSSGVIISSQRQRQWLLRTANRTVATVYSCNNVVAPLPYFCVNSSMLVLKQIKKNFGIQKEHWISTCLEHRGLLITSGGTAFGIRHSANGKRHSAFGKRHSAFGIRHCATMSLLCPRKNVFQKVF